MPEREGEETRLDLVGVTDPSGLEVMAGRSGWQQVIAASEQERPGGWGGPGPTL